MGNTGKRANSHPPKCREQQGPRSNLSSLEILWYGESLRSVHTSLMFSRHSVIRKHKIRPRGDWKKKIKKKNEEESKPLSRKCFEKKWGREK